MQQVRILLSRDRGALKHSAVRHGYCVRASDPQLQLREIAERFGLELGNRIFTRCPACNAPLQPVDKQTVLSRVPPRTAATFDHFTLCSGCSKVYWKGSHHKRMLAVLQRLVGY
jgi:uncharacterized protein with PIN domain